MAGGDFPLPPPVVCVCVGRNFDASEAVTLGLVSRVLPNVDELTKAVMGLANEIADKSPVAVYGTKVRTPEEREAFPRPPRCILLHRVVAGNTS